MGGSRSPTSSELKIMERFLLEKLDLRLSPLSDDRRRLRSLATARSLLLNPGSSDSTRRAVADALLRSLDHHRLDPAYLRHAIKVLGDAAALHRPLATSVASAVGPLLNGGDEHLAADGLAVLASLADSSLLCSVLDEDLIVSLAASPVVSVRSQLLDLLVSSVRIARCSDSTLARPHLVLQVLLGFTADLYPLVRRAALDGLAVLFKEAGPRIENPMVECCYDRAVTLLRDDENFVRSAAIRMVSECGHIFATAEEGIVNRERMDSMFVQLCSMARDMSMKVRLEAFIALGKVQLVSESVLLQSLSKKVLGIKGGKNVVAECFMRESKFTLLCAAGAFVHGIEDEFHEVRTAACKSLGMLTIFSIKFADDALNLLMDMLNDDAAAVRLQTLQTLFYMAANDRLTVQERHMHMFLGLLADISALIRSAARKVLRLMRLPELKIFKYTIDTLVTNIETYAEEEEEIFFVLFFIGKNHGKFAAKLAKEFAKELMSSCDGELGLDSPRMAALVVLAISSPFSDKRLVRHIPASVFSCAVPLLGRISCSLRHVINQDSLLAYLCYHSGMLFSTTISESKEAELPNIIGGVISSYRNWPEKIFSSSWLTDNETSEINFKENILDPSKISTPLEEFHLNVEVLDEEIMQSIKLILKSVTRTWRLIQSHCIYEAKRALRACMEELEMIASNADGSVVFVLAFTSLYVQVIQLFAEIWEQLKPKRFRVVGMVALDILLEELDMLLRRMRYGFTGLCGEEECHILELTLVAYVLRLYEVRACPNGRFRDAPNNQRMASATPCADPISITLKKLHVIISRLGHLSEEGMSDLSAFVKELKRTCIEESLRETPYSIPVFKLLELFCLEQIPLIGRFKHVKAELQALGNDSESPLTFISGMPVGIAFQIILYNVSNSDMVWLRMAVGKSIEYVFLDLYQFEGSFEMRRCIVNLPFYATPKATSFLLKACVCMECPIEYVTDLKKGQGMPKCDIALLCEETDVYIVRLRTVESKCSN